MAAVAATDTEVAVAWMERDSANRPVLGFARLSSSLDRLTSSRVSEASLARISTLWIAPLPSGWVVAGYSEPDLFAYAFDSTGQQLAHTTVATIPEEPNVGLILASRPNGGPLLLWEFGDAMHVSMIAADGRSATAPAVLTTEDLVGSGAPSVAWVGDAFYVARSLERPDNREQLHLKRIDANGTLTAAFDALPGVRVRYPMLVTGSDDLRVLYLGIDGPPIYGALQWQRLDVTGRAVTEPIVIGNPRRFPWGRGVAFGADTGVLLLTDTQSPSLMETVRVAGDGQTVTPVRTVARGAKLYDSLGHDIVRRGPDAVVMWFHYDGYFDPPLPPMGPLQLARVAM